MDRADIDSPVHSDTDSGVLKPCEPCRHWSSDGCLQYRPGFPVYGDFCFDYEREPGVD